MSTGFQSNAPESGLRIWRYLKKENAWVHHGKGAQVTLAHNKVTFPAGSAPLPWSLQEGDFLLERPVNYARASSVQKIEADHVIDYIPEAALPDWADFWYWDPLGEGEKGGAVRIYARRGGLKENDKGFNRRRKAVESVIEQDEGDYGAMLIINTSPIDSLSGECRVYSYKTRKWLDDEYEATDLTGDLKGVAVDPHPGALTYTDRTAVAFAVLIRHHKTLVEEAEKAAREGNATKAWRIFKGIFEPGAALAAGAQPGPLTGYDAPAAAVGQLDTAAQLLQWLLETYAPIPNFDGNRTVTAASSDPSMSGVKGLAGWSDTAGTVVADVGMGDAAWEAIGAVAQFALDCRAAHRMNKDWEELSKTAKGLPIFEARYGTRSIHQARLKQAGTIGLIDVVGGLGGASVGLTNSIHTLTSLAAAVPSTVAPGLGCFTGGLMTVKLSLQAEKSRKRWEILVKKQKDLTEKQGGSGRELNVKTSNLLAYAIKKSHHKFATKTTGAVAASLTAASSALLICGAVLGAANCWNPIGWGIGIATFLLGAGLLCYRIHRKRTSKQRALRRGGLDTSNFPRQLVRQYKREMKRSYISLESQTLAVILASYGVTLSDVWLNEASAMTKIQRHLQQ